ncbi:MAG: putative quinol monooxygenase [Bacillota bacterium]
MAEAHYMYAWEFLAAPGKIAEFRQAYGPDGDWVRLFRRAQGYVRSELHQDGANPQRFVTLDYWESEAACEEFRRRHVHDYEDLDVRCEQFTLKEREIGRFHLV